MQAPTSIRSSATSPLSVTPAQPTSNDLSQVEALSRALGSRQGGDSAGSANGQPLENDYDSCAVIQALLSKARPRNAACTAGTRVLRRRTGAGRPEQSATPSKKRISAEIY